MTPTRFPQVNRTLVAPDCFDLPSCVTPTEVITRWEPTAEDLERILNGGPVWLRILTTAGTQPPVCITTECPFEEAG